MGRRVYELDGPLLLRISDFQKKVKLSSEVAAIRHLIGAALNMHETRQELITRHHETQDDSILAGHPLIARLHQEDGQIVRADFKDGSNWNVRDPA